MEMELILETDETETETKTQEIRKQQKSHTKLVEEITNYEFILSTHGHPQLVYENHTFNRNNATEHHVYWRCAHARRLKCKARIVSSSNKLIATNPEHNHIPMKRLVYGMGVNNSRNLSRNNHELNNLM